MKKEVKNHSPKVAVMNEYNEIIEMMHEKELDCAIKSNT